MLRTKSILIEAIRARDYRLTGGPLGSPASLATLAKVLDGDCSVICRISSPGKTLILQVFVDSPDQCQERFRRIQDHLSRIHDAERLLPFRFDPQGLIAGGSSWAVAATELPGHARTLKDFVTENISRPDLLLRVGAEWWTAGEVLFSRGLAHGRLKPSRIYVVEGPSLKVTDFEALAVSALSSSSLASNGGDPRGLDQFATMEGYLTLCALASFPSRLSKSDNLEELISADMKEDTISYLEASSLPGLSHAAGEYARHRLGQSSGIRLSAIRSELRGNGLPGLRLAKLPQAESGTWRPAGVIEEGEVSASPITKVAVSISRPERLAPPTEPSTSQPEELPELPAATGPPLWLKVAATLILAAVIYGLLSKAGEDSPTDGQAEPITAVDSLEKDTQPETAEIRAAGPGRGSHGGSSDLPRAESGSMSGKRTVFFDRHPQDLQSVDSFFVFREGEPGQSIVRQSMQDTVLLLDPGKYGYGFLDANSQIVDQRGGGLIVR